MVSLEKILAQALNLTSELGILDPDKYEDYRASQQSQNKDLTGRVERYGSKVARTSFSTPPTSPTAMSPSPHSRSYYQKCPFPKFT